jgi:hypothetical protein
MKLTPLRTIARSDRSALAASVAVLVTLGMLVVVTSAGPAGSTPPRQHGLAALRPTKTTITCKQETLTPGASTACTTKVADSGSGKKAAPAGTVTFASSAPGSFDVESCTLAVSGAAAATCSMTYQPDAVGSGTHALTASYSGSETHAAGIGRFELYVTPSNDGRRNATTLRTPPSSVEGSTIGATSDYSDPELGCGGASSTVWYSLEIRSSGRIAVRIRARGRLDAVVAVFRRVRSQYKPLGCVPTDEKGIGGVSFQAERRGQYLIVVGERANSASSAFRLELFAPPLARAPGASLPSDGTTSSVDPLTRPEAAWSVALAAGRTYRINLAPDRSRCLPLSLYGPGTSSFGAGHAVRGRVCGGYLVFTPGPDEGGRYSLLVRAQGNRGGTQRYRLRVARAGRDDTAPGLLIRSRQTRRGSLSARSIDVLDLYRFDVTHRTDVTIRLRVPRSAAFELLLLSSEGNYVRCACGNARSPEVRAQLDEGQYFVAVRARGQSAGPYRVSLLIREITSTVALIEAVSNATAKLGSEVQLSAEVTPLAAVGGRVRFRVDRFDPIEGWQFSRIITVRVASGGLATVAWLPPTVGRWRVRGFFAGTTAASPSASGHALLLVEG